MNEPRLWCDVLNPAPTSPDPDPLAGAAALHAAAQVLAQADDPEVRAVGARLAEWLARGGDLHRALGVRGARGRRGVQARRQQQQRVEALQAAAASTGERTLTGQALALARVIESDTPLGRELRAAGVARSPRQLHRVLAAGHARSRDTSS